MNDEETSLFLKTKQRVSNLRGAILDNCILLEQILEMYIALYFVPNDSERAYQLFEILLSTNRVSFESKKQVFCIIIERDNNAFYKSHPTLSKDLSYIIEQRNIFAHYAADLNNVDSEVLVFIKHKNSTEEVEFNKNKILDLHEKLQKYIVEISRILKEKEISLGISTPPSGFYASADSKPS